VDVIKSMYAVAITEVKLKIGISKEFEVKVEVYKRSVLRLLSIHHCDLEIFEQSSSKNACFVRFCMPMT